ncbi:MAG: flagellin [Oscillibacter sp.]|uniref:flagellin N-terminal helical domain-containing protein n=1 Tax=Oscillibacter sp. TaxID=1945593 RepID=UPI00216BADA1|nr:flagellin [Oscillibacter sp.]MCI9112711.1 flagellin [Oscillibacter sp.]
MRIQHNIMAMNAYRNYNTNTSALSKNLEKLSSGYKINRAGDDAAGLAISEKMRAQITGLNAAQKNVKDGISLVKTAEGAMQEIQDMLNRMDYLATQSANGTYDDPVDRVNLNKEMDALKAEINRIADSANFNGISLLNGNLDAKAAQAEKDAAMSDAFTEVTSFTKIKDHEDGATAQKMVFTLDLTDLKAESTSTGNETVTVAYAGVTLTASVSAGGMTTFSVAGGNTGSVTIGNHGFSYSFAGNKLTFEMKTEATTTLTGTGNTISADVNVEGGTDTKLNFGEGLQPHIEKDLVVGKLTTQAQGSFNLTTDMITDGGSLKIGDLEFTFTKGTENKFNGTSITLSSDLFDANGAITTDGLKKAAALISGAAKDKGDFIIGNDAGSVILKLTERVTDDGKTKPGYELKGPSNATDATWKGVVSYATKEQKEAAAASSTKAGKLTLQIGDTSDTFNQMDVNVGDMHVTAMGFDLDKDGKITANGKSINDVNIKTAENAHEAIDVIKNAINYVSSIRGDLGAVQNRLEHTANNLSVMAENIQDAESTIRDTDVAEEMMSYTKNNILVQSAQAMLAQANAVPQGVLQLLG